jgi:uncharacterized protein YozE (UPF0346 family)
MQLDACMPLAKLSQQCLLPLSTRAASDDVTTMMFDLPVFPQNQDGFKWTSRYLASNAAMQEVANTLLELMSLPPHASLHADKTTVSISSECDHDRISGLVGLATSSSSDNRFRYQVGRWGVREA